MGFSSGTSTPGSLLQKGYVDSIRPLLEAGNKELAAARVNGYPIFSGIKFEQLDGGSLYVSAHIHNERCGPGKKNPSTLLRDVNFKDAAHEEVRWAMRTAARRYPAPDVDVVFVTLRRPPGGDGRTPTHGIAVVRLG